MRKKIILIAMVLLSCSSDQSPLFNGFKELKAEAKINLLHSLQDDEKRPFEKKSVQKELMRISKDESESVEVRIEAFNVLSVAEGSDFSDLYLELMQNPSAPVGLKTNLSLKLTDFFGGNKIILEYCLEKLNDPKEAEGVRMNIALGLGYSNVPRTEEVVNALIEAYEKRNTPESVRINAITSLANFADMDQAQKAIEKAIKDPSSEIRFALAQHLVNSPNGAFLPWIKTLAEDSDEGVASEAKKGLE